MIAFTVFGTPRTAGSKIPFRTKSGKLLVRDDAGRLGAEWKRSVAQRAGEAMAGGSALDGPLGLSVMFVVARPMGHFSRRQRMGRTTTLDDGLLRSAPEYPCGRPDTTKMLRAVEDALIGVVYRDDAQIVAQYASKVYGSPARAEIEVFRIGEKILLHP